VTQLELGSYLLGLKALSRDQSLACTTCHDYRFGFSEGRRLNSHTGALAARKAPPLFNLSLFSNFMADGRAASLPEQVIIPLESEMRVDWPLACRRIMADPRGDHLLQAATLGPCGANVVVQSLAAYVGSLVSGNSRFDQFYYGGNSDALTEEEQRGLRVFVRKGHCSTCHLVNGFAAPFTDGSFHSVGIGYTDGVYRDHGRMAVSNQAGDDGAFKTPTLRNVSLRTSFMHDGSVSSLRDVIDYYDRGGTVGARNQDPRIHKLFLSDGEKNDLLDFLKSLSSPVQTYIPEPIAGGGSANGNNSASSPQ
jgi:cytochrome c peroxidase